MTTKEIKQIEDINKSIQDLVLALEKNNTTQNEKIEVLSKKVDSTTKPFYFESDILRSVKESIYTAINSSLTGYNSPLFALTKSVVEEHSEEMKKILSRNFIIAIRNKDFEETIKDELSRTLGRTIVKSNEALFGKLSNDMKNDAVFKAECTLAMSNLVKKYLDKKE